MVGKSAMNLLLQVTPLTNSICELKRYYALCKGHAYIKFGSSDQE